MQSGAVGAPGITNSFGQFNIEQDPVRNFVPWSFMFSTSLHSKHVRNVSMKIVTLIKGVENALIFNALKTL